MALRTPLLRRFGLTALTVPEIGLRVGTSAALDHTALLHVASELGVGLFALDGADGADGEKGDWLKAAAKDLPEAAFVALDVDSAGLLPAVEDASARLERPMLDLVTLPEPPRSTGTAAALATMRQRGLARAVGAVVSGPDDLAGVIDAGCFDAVEIVFNVVQQETLLACSDLLRHWRGAVLVRQPLAAEVWEQASAPGDGAAVVPGVEAQILRELADLFGGDRTPVQAALQVALLPDLVSTLLPRCRTGAQVAECVAASTELPPLTPAQLASADRIISGYGYVSALATHLAPHRPVQVRVARVTGRFDLARAADPVGGSEGGERSSTEPAAQVLAQPVRIGDLVLPNRIVRSATTERAVDLDGLPTAAMKQIHRDLAAGGAGLVITGLLSVSPETEANSRYGYSVMYPGQPVQAWEPIVAACHEAGAAKMCAQIGYGGVLSPSDLAPNEIAGQVVAAASAAAEAGFDAVQLHAAHGYLLGQLLSQQPPLRNRPSDHSGLELLLRIVEAVCDAVGPGLAVLVKANVSDMVPGGYGPADATVFAAALAGTRVSGVEWSAWTPTAPVWHSSCRFGVGEERSEGFFVPFAADVKARHPHLAVGTCSGFRSAAGMARAIADAGLDFVALSRPLIAEPDLPARILGGAPEARCDACNRCLLEGVSPLRCVRWGEE